MTNACPTIVRRRRSGSCSAALIAGLLVAAAPGAAPAQIVGKVVTFEALNIRSSPVLSGSYPEIHVDDILETALAGRANLAFGHAAGDTGDDSEAVPGGSRAIFMGLTLGSNSTLVVHRPRSLMPGEPSAELELRGGSAYATAIQTAPGNVRVVTEGAVTLAKETAFLLTYDPPTETTVVIGVSGTTEVSGLIGAPVSLPSRYITIVRKGDAPKRPEPLSEERFLQYLEVLELVGAGRAESFSLAPKRPHKETKLPDPGNACLWPSAPTCIPPEPIGGNGHLLLHF